MINYDTTKEFIAENFVCYMSHPLVKCHSTGNIKNPELMLEPVSVFIRDDVMFSKLDELAKDIREFIGQELYYEIENVQGCLLE